jgi:hypothetical protein
VAWLAASIAIAGDARTSVAASTSVAISIASIAAATVVS